MAVPAIIKLSSYPWMTNANSNKTLAQAGVSVENLKTTAPDYLPSCTVHGITAESDILGRAVLNAGMTDALWRGAQYQSPAVTQSGVGRLLSRNRIEVDLFGSWLANDYLHYAFGTHNFLAGAGTGNDAYNDDLGGFEIVHWRDNWKGAPSNRSNGDRVLFGAFHGGSNKFDDYSEATRILGAFRLNGGLGLRGSLRVRKLLHALLRCRASRGPRHALPCLGHGVTLQQHRVRP